MPSSLTRRPRPSEPLAAASPPAAGPKRRLAAAGLVALMALGSVAMWVANPLGWLYLASVLSSSPQPSMGPYILVMAGVIVTAVILGKLLGMLSRAHARLYGQHTAVRVRMPWTRSMRGERNADAGMPRSVLDVVMITSVSIALGLAAVWFFVLAGSSLPSA